MATRKRQQKLSADMKQIERKKSRNKEQKDNDTKELGQTPTFTDNDDADESLLQQLDTIFMVKHPPELLNFWQHSVKLNEKKPLEAYSEMNSLTLAGPFLLLAHLRANKASQERCTFLLKSRFPTDLPEMETILIHRDGRFCYWRDVPEEMPTMLVHVKGGENGEHFPLVSICGKRDIFSALQYLLLIEVTKSTTKKATSSGSKSIPMAHLFPANYDMTIYGSDYLQTLKKRRAKESMGMPFHGIGIKVPVNNKGIGYRPVSDDNKENAQLKRNIEAMGTTGREEEKDILKKKFYQVYSWVQFANDEMDFGMGLEFGHDIFMSNYPCFDGMAKSVLGTAYELLDRKQFATILEKHMEVRRQGLNDGRTK